GDQGSGAGCGGVERISGDGNQGARRLEGSIPRMPGTTLVAPLPGPNTKALSHQEHQGLNMAELEPISAELDRIGKIIVDVAYKLHVKYGPGLLEKVYQICLMHDLIGRGLKVEREVPVNINHNGVEIMDAFKIDLLVNDCVVIEVKAE